MTPNENTGDEEQELTAAEIVNIVTGGDPEANDIVNQATGH